MKVLLRQQYQTKCQNAELKTKKDFFVEKSESKNKDYDWDFKVFLDKAGCGILSELNANTPGRCNKVETFAGSEGCGLATTLMEICFADEDVGGIDPENDWLFEDKSRVLTMWESKTIPTPLISLKKVARYGNRKLRAHCVFAV